MRRTLLALAVSLPALGCASVEKSYRDFAPEPPPALSASAPSPEADALVARFYGPGGVDRRAIADALARAPGHSGLHEIAGYEAWVRADAHEAFGHFLAAAADQNAISAALYLWEMRSSARTTTEHLRAQALLREIMAQHPNVSVRQLAAFDLARELRMQGEHEEAEELVRGLGFVDAWQVLGAFDNDQGKGFQTEYPPEQDAGQDASRTYAGVRMPIRFRPLATGKLDGALPLGDAVWPATAVVVYAETFVTAGKGRQVDLRLTTTNAVRVWHNGKLCGSDDRIYHDELDNVVVRITLEAGQSRLLVKSAHESGPFRLAARITELDGSIPSDLRYAASGHESPPPHPRAPSVGIVPPGGAIDRLADKNRRRFLQARLWAREGHSRRATWYLSPLLSESRDNPTVMFFAAAALGELNEAGKALDLWSRGAARFPEASGFLLDRARFYASRRLWDRAEKDLAAVIARGSAGTREAHLELAYLYGRRDWAVDRCQELEAAAAPAPDDRYALAELGRCKLDRGYVEEAESLFRRAHALAPGDATLLQRLFEVALRRLDYGAAEGWLKELLAARPSSPEVRFEEAELHRRRGRAAEAQRALEAALALCPDAPWGYERLAQLALEAKDRAGAERWLRLSLERDPENASLAQRLAALSPSALPLGDRLAPTAEDIERAVRSADKVKVHAGSHLVVLLDDEVTAVNPDGSSKRIVTQVMQAVSTDGRDALIQAPLPTSGRLNVMEAYSIRKGGERQEASSIQGGVVRFRSLEVGSITVMQYTHFAPPPRFLPTEYVGQRPFQAVNGQVQAARWRLVLPKDRALDVAVRGPIEHGAEVVGDQKVWTFSVKDAPPLLPEPMMPPYADEQWTAVAGTLKSWDGYARWESALLGEAFQPSAELDALAKKLTAGAATPRDKILKLWAHVAQEIRYQQDYEDSIAGVKPHSASMVVERGYGDCKDKAVLMIRLAKAVGVELRFAVLRTTGSGKVWKEVPNQQFNHAIVYAPKQAGIDEPFFVDTTTNGLDIGNMRTDDEGAWSLVIDHAGRWEFVRIPYQSADLELVRHHVEVALTDPQKAIGRDHIEVRGAVAAGVRMALRSAEGEKKYYQSLSDHLFPGTTLVSGRADHAQDLTRPVSVQLDIDLSNAVRPEDDRFRFEVPLPFPVSHSAALATRAYPLRLRRGAEALTMDVDLGEAQRAFHVPADFSVDHPCFTVSRKAETKGTHVVVTASYKNTCAEIAPADYPAFRAAVHKVVARAQEMVVFGPATKKR
jgi:tetratricopeptide (TPR) repeat protein/transglutaminase-like putative cysteine protease